MPTLRPTQTPALHGPRGAALVGDVRVVEDVVSAFSGPQGRGAMKERRRSKRAEAYERNARSFASRKVCGHVHGEAVKCKRAAS